VVKHEEYDKIVQHFEHEGSAFLYAVTFNFDESLVIAGGGTGRNEVRVFDYASGRLVSSIHSLPEPVLCMDSKKNANFFAFGSMDGHMHIVEVNHVEKLD